MIRPDWPAPNAVRVLVTTRDFGDLAGDEGRRRLRALLPADPAWLRQVHGTTVVDLDKKNSNEGDAAVTRTPGRVCAVLAADCMPVLLADEAGSAVAAAHAGWRGLSAGVLEAAVSALGVSPRKQLAWLGPAIGPRVYEVGEDVRAAFPQDAGAFAPTRPGHWNLNLYAVARRKLRACGVTRIGGGDYCTYSEPGRFFSYRRDRARERMAAVIWIA